MKTYSSTESNLTQSEEWDLWYTRSEVKAAYLRHCGFTFEGVRRQGLMNYQLVFSVPHDQRAAFEEAVSVIEDILADSRTLRRFASKVPMGGTRLRLEVYPYVGTGFWDEDWCGF